MLVTSDMEEYKQLREQFLAIASEHVNPSILEEIKKFYRLIINSNRQYSKITTLEELIRVLEKRGRLHYNDVGSMRDIAQLYFKDTGLDDLVSKFQEKIEPQLSRETRITLYDPGKFEETEISIENDSEVVGQLEEPLLKPKGTIRPEEYATNCWKRRNIFQNQVCVSFAVGFVALVVILVGIYYGAIDYKMNLSNMLDTVNRVRNVASASSSQDVQSEESNSTSSGQSIGESATTDRIKDLVFLNLCERLGVSWRGFARHLNVQEAEIDKLHKKNPKDLQRNSEKILNIYFSRESPNNWKMPLIEALEKIRRPDLKELVLRLLCSENI